MTVTSIRTHTEQILQFHSVQENYISGVSRRWPEQKQKMPRDLKYEHNIAL